MQLIEEAESSASIILLFNGRRNRRDFVFCLSFVLDYVDYFR